MLDCYEIARIIWRDVLRRVLPQIEQHVGAHCLPRTSVPGVLIVPLHGCRRSHVVRLIKRYCGRLILAERQAITLSRFESSGERTPPLEPMFSRECMLDIAQRGLGWP